LVEELIVSHSKYDHRDSTVTSDGLDDSFISASKSIGESIHKNPKELAYTLEKSVSTLLKHFNDQLSVEADYVPKDGGPMINSQSSSVIPGEIWDAMADIDLVRKELLSQAALATMVDSSTYFRSSGNSRNFGSSANSETGISVRRRGRETWQL